MTRTEAVVLLVLALGLVVAGSVWLLGPWALVVSGAVMFLFALLGAPIKE